MLSVDIKKELHNQTLDLTFSVREEEILGLLGASGAGKSMTLKCIAGIETPDSGRITFYDQVLFDSAKGINLPPQKRQIGYLFQDYALFPHMTVEQNIQIAIKERGEQSLVEQLLKRFKIEALAKQYPGQISGGQKQRVALARMLASNPKVILLDEPFSALDSHLRQQLEKEMILEIRALQIPVIMVTHSRDEVYRMCNQVGCIEQGKLLEKKEVKAFFHAPETVQGARLSGCKNIVEVSSFSSFSLDVPAGTTHIGIRAHDFYDGIMEDEALQMRIPVYRYEIMEELFEYTIFFQFSEASEWLQWKVDKRLWKHKSSLDYVIVNKHDILYLS